MRFKPTSVGGGFGSKLDLSVQPYLALAAWTLGRPVRLTYTRPESMMSTTKRHPSRLHARVGATRDGRLTAMDFTGEFNTGAYASWGSTVANRVRCTPAVRTSRRVSRAHRGHPHERAAVGRVPRVRRAAIDDRAGMPVRELADAVGMDRLEFRHRNALTAGVPTVTGQVFASGIGYRDCLEALRPHWERARPRRRRRTPMVARPAPASASPACGTAAGTRRCRTPRRSRSGSGATDASRSIKERSTWDRAPTP